MDFLDVDNESHRLVLSLLGPRDLCSLAGTCRYFYHAVFSGIHAEQLWKQWCMNLLGPGIVSLHGSAVPAGYKAGAIFWRDLWVAGHKLDHIRWWRQGSHQLRLSAIKVTEAEALAQRMVAEQAAEKIVADNEDGLGPERHAAVLAEHEAAANGAVSLQASLARSAHTADLLGTKVVITGGILRDGATHVDVVVIDLAHLGVMRPEVKGSPPSTRFRHTTALIQPSPGSLLDDLVLGALGPHQDADTGDLLFCFGGYNTTGEEFGADSTYVLWVAKDGSQHIWIQIQTYGSPPSSRFHHSCNSFAGGKRVIVFGGEGYMLDDGGLGSAPCAYILDVDTLTWQRSNTHALAPQDSPGSRSLHVTTVRVSPHTGKEELVLVGGYSSSLLAEMQPYTLDLESLLWQCWPGLEQECRGADVALPSPRQRMGSMRVTDEWFLICGGSPTSGNFLDDVQRLHIPTLTWRKPPRMSGRPSRALRRIAGHSFSGLLAFGGCIPTVMGIMPVEKLDVLLLGQANKGLIPLDRRQAQAMTEPQIGAPIIARPPAPPATLSDSSDGDSPGGSAREPPIPRATRSTSVEDEVLDQLMADQLLSKGQRVNIGSPGTFFRPVYATAGGAKLGTSRVRGKLQVISTSVLSDAELLAETQRRLEAAGLSAADAKAAAYEDAYEDDLAVQAALAGTGLEGHEGAQPLAGPSSSAREHSRRLFRRSISAPKETWKRGAADDKGKAKVSDLGPHEEHGPPTPMSPRYDDGPMFPREQAEGDEHGANEEHPEDDFVPLLLLWSRPEAHPGDGGEAHLAAGSMERIPSLDGTGHGAASRRYVLCGGTDPPVLLESTSYGVKSILTAAKAEVFRLPGGPATPWPVYGAHAMYVVYSVRNKEIPPGPNPFSGVRVPWHPSWWDPQVGSLLPSDADLDPLAVERLRFGDVSSS